MVNLTRKDLATALGLALPADLDGERAMWTVTSELVGSRHTEAAHLWDRFRSRP
jgi:hypothetical protein